MHESSVIKIYLPKVVEGNYLYGAKRLDAKEGSAITSYFVISCVSKPLKNSNLELLGIFCNDFTQDDKVHGLSIIKNENGKIARILLNNRDLPRNHRVLLLRFDKEKFLKSYDEEYLQESVEKNFAMFIAKALKTEHIKDNGTGVMSALSNKSHAFLAISSSVASKVFQPFVPIFKNTVIYQHCSNWQECLRDERSKNGFFVLDFLLGILFFLLMSHIQHSGRYFMGSTEFIVNKLRKLLEMLDGSPVGLKLNVQLNNFLLSCFMYHVDLWWNFIVIVEPAIHYLFLPITLFGLMGFSFQCAMLCDVITLITLHAHCFYIYAAMIYKLELSSIRSLLRIVLGRRLNVLKNRVESQDYTNRQLFLATLFFTTLLFLLPTVIIYYLVFASLRLLIYCLSYVLMKIQFEVLTFPFYKYLRWLCGYSDCTNLSMELISNSYESGTEICEFNLTLNACFPWQKSPFTADTTAKLTQPLSIASFASFLVRGEMMAFLPNI